MTKKILDGYNLNEVKLIEKPKEIKDFLKNFSIFLIKIVFSSNISCFCFISNKPNSSVNYLNQKTIKSPVEFEGIGLHSGKIQK